MLRGARLFAERLDPLDDEIGLGKHAEVLRQDRLDPVDGRRRILDVRGTAFVTVGIVDTAVVFLVAELREEGLQVAQKPTSFRIASISPRRRATSVSPIW